MVGGEGQWRPKHPLQCLKGDTCLGTIAREQKQGTMARFCRVGCQSHGHFRRLGNNKFLLKLTYNKRGHECLFPRVVVFHVE